MKQFLRIRLPLQFNSISNAETLSNLRGCMGQHQSLLKTKKMTTDSFGE